MFASATLAAATAASLPTHLVPPLDPFGLPAPSWVFILLMNLTLTLHFLLIGYVFTIALLGTIWAAAPEGSAARWMLRRTEKPLPVALSFAITLGVAPLLFVQVLYPSFFYTANIILGFQWFGIIPVLIGGFYMIYVLYNGQFMGRRIPRFCEAAGRAGIFASVAYVLTTQTANAVLLLQPDRWQGARAGRGTMLGMLDLPLLGPRLSHNVLAALIVGSVWLVVLGTLTSRRADEAAEAGRGRAMAKLGALLGGGALLAQLVVGLWLFIAERGEVQKMLFSGRPAAILWMSALLLVAGLGVLLAMALMAPASTRMAAAAGGTLALLLGGMFAGREAARQVWLAPYFKMSDWTVNVQVSSLVLFLVMFVVALVTVAVMARWLARAGAAPAALPASEPLPAVESPQ